MSKQKKDKAQQNGLSDFEILQLAATLVAGMPSPAPLGSDDAHLNFRIEQMLQCAALIHANLGDAELAAALKEAKQEGHRHYMEVVKRACPQLNPD